MDLATMYTTLQALRDSITPSTIKPECMTQCRLHIESAMMEIKAQQQLDAYDSGNIVYATEDGKVLDRFTVLKSIRRRLENISL